MVWKSGMVSSLGTTGQNLFFSKILLDKQLQNLNCLEYCHF